MSAIRILLVNEHRFWQPGDWLEGAVVLTWRRRRQVCGVRLKLSGDEGVHWTESVSTNTKHWLGRLETHTHEETRSGSEKVLDTVFTFWGFPSGSKNETTLEPGLHVWPFRIALPATISHASVEHHLDSCATSSKRTSTESAVLEALRSRSDCTLCANTAFRAN